MIVNENRVNTGKEFNRIPKSPSDTTIYAPALIKSPQGITEKDIAIDKIANFVEEIRIQQKEKESDYSTPTRPTRRDEAGSSKDDSRAGCSSNSRSLASKLILEAEQFKANVEQPQGTYDTTNTSVDKVTDDDFFHLVCHVDIATRNKIEKGEFVDLEKLLPHDKLKRPQAEGSTRLGWWQKGADTYLAPVEKDRKITNVKKMGPGFQDLFLNLLQG